MKKVILISILSTFLFSCDDKFPGYFQKDPEVYMKLLSFESGDQSFDEASHASVTVKVIGREGLFYRHYKNDILSLDSNNPLAFLLQYLKEGDSCSFMVQTDRILREFQPVVLHPKTSDYVEVTLKVHRYFKPDEYEQYEAVHDMEMREQLILEEYIKEVNAKPYKGLYIEKLHKGKGKSIKKGDIITIAYKGYFTNRLEFDKISGATAFTFTYGTSGQVIEGLDIAINGMKKGEKSKIILSSQLAFGEEGSTTLVVPSYTTVIYELEILNVK